MFNYKTQNVWEELKKVAPNGVDVYVDLVGGNYYHNIVIDHMNVNGRVVVIGSIETYNEVNQKTCTTFS